MAEEDGRHLEREVLRFIALLRSLGIAVGTGQAQDAIGGLGLVDLHSRAQVYRALRAILLDAHPHEPIFEHAFHQFWNAIEPPRPLPVQVSSAMQRQARRDTAEGASGSAGPTLQAAESSETVSVSLADTEVGDEPEVPDPALAYSQAEALRQKNFADLTPDELARVRALLSTLTLAPLPRRVRRTERASSGPILDLRHAARRNLRYGGEMVILPRRRHSIRHRRLVLLCDISGSMDRYTRMLLYFLHAATQRSHGLESFVFGTRLTRITRQLRRRDPDRALDEVEGQVLDFAGGTRIGDAIATFNRRWARRVLRGGAVVVIISDGWDRGDPDVLAAEMAHLHRSCHRLIWLNPLLGMADYRPLTRGMSAALPHVDLFLPAHSLASLESLADLLGRLDAGPALSPPHRAHQPV